MTESNLTPRSDPLPPTSGAEFLSLIFRHLVGYGILFACLIVLLQRAPWTLSAVDAVYWLTLVVLFLMHGRAARRGGTAAEWRRSGLRGLVIATALWIAAQSVHLIE